MASSLPLPELSFLSPITTPKHRLSLSRLSLSKLSLSRNHRRHNLSLRTRVRALKEDSVTVEERESKLIEEVNGSLQLNVNGDASTSTSYNGSMNGSVSDNGRSNGSLMKYVNGNGVAAEVVVEEAEEVSEAKKDGKKKSIEEIGQEEAWFKRSSQDQIEV